MQPDREEFLTSPLQEMIPCAEDPTQLHMVARHLSARLWPVGGGRFTRWQKKTAQKYANLKEIRCFMTERRKFGEVTVTASGVQY